MSSSNRNDHCPCGSGKKHKQCCLRRVEARKAGMQVAADSVSRMLQAAIAHLQAGRLSEAEAVCQHILQTAPNHPDALHYLGIIAHQTGKNETAIELIGKAISVKPENAQAHYNLGSVLYIENRLDSAIESFHKAILLNPDYVEAHNSLGSALHALGELDEAVAHYRKALLIKPDFAEAYSNLGYALRDQGKLDEAIECCRKAIFLKPNFAEAHVNLGNAFQDRDELEEAVISYRNAVTLKPDFAVAHSNLGNALKAQNKIDAAINACCTAISLNPNYAEAYSNLGNALKDQGRVDEAIESYRQALRLKPSLDKAHSNLLMTLQFSPRFTPSEIFAEHKRFAEQFETPLKPLWPEHLNLRDPGKRLKVGYVSADFRQHAVALFIEPVLANHDASQIELFCYYNNTLHDAITERIRCFTDHWIPCKGMSDALLAKRIVADGIDILVDLSGHTADNRLLAFARKPAPIQITYLGYPGTSGLSAMDYRITDWCTNPEGSDVYYSEKLLRLPDSLWCYRPTSDMPEIGPLPAVSNGYITFGSFNNFNKVDDLCIELWSALLKTIPTARLLMVTVPEGTAREQLIEKFAHHGIPAERLELYGRLSSVEFHRMFQRVDITLDPLFVNGATSTCESLWMGVPVLSLVGDRFLTRAGFSIMSAAGLHDFAPHTTEDYLRVAAYLAGNIPLLAEIHDNMRTGVAASPLTDTAIFTRNLEAAYRNVWVEYCQGKNKNGAPAEIKQAVATSIPKMLQEALTHHQAGRLLDADAIYRQILQIEPNHPDALHYLGIIAHQMGRNETALDLIGNAISIKPDNAQAHYNLGSVLYVQNRLDAAIENFRKAILLKPDYAEAYNSLGGALHALGELDEAVAHYRKALLIKPDYAEAYSNLGDALRSQSKLDEAVECCRKAILLNPGFAEAHVNLGIALEGQGKLDEAINCYHQALSFRSDYAEAYNNLGNALKNQGRLDEAIENYRQALRLKPRFDKAHSNLLMTLQFSPRFTPSEIFAEHKRFAEQLETPLKPLWPEHRNLRDPEKRLKVGYVSADFCNRVVAFFIAPVLANRDASQIELFCYYNNTEHDHLTDHIRSLADHWIPCVGMPDAQLAERIFADGIDILVDLSGHTAGNRLLMFARKPAPIQVTYLGYPGTSGLTAMDYRITDRYANPEGSDIYYSEKLLRLPDSLWCYQPTSDMPEIGPLPALSNGYITFGSLNNFNKIDDVCIELWSALLRTIPTSRLLMVTVPEGRAREQLIEKFASHGIPTERLELYGRLPFVEFHQMFRQVDITLDPVFINGATTTCESLWMGVPVLSLVGKRFLMRAGLSIMSAAGLHDFATHTTEDYLRVAAYLADNIPLLAEIHDNMRTGVAASPLADTATFTRNLEAAYRNIWMKYCQGDSKAHEHP